MRSTPKKKSNVDFGNKKGETINFDDFSSRVTSSERSSYFLEDVFKLKLHDIKHRIPPRVLKQAPLKHGQNKG